MSMAVRVEQQVKKHPTSETKFSKFHDNSTILMKNRIETTNAAKP